MLLWMSGQADKLNCWSHWKSSPLYSKDTASSLAEEYNHLFVSVGENTSRASEKLTETFGLRSTSDLSIPILS